MHRKTHLSTFLIIICIFHIFCGNKNVSLATETKVLNENQIIEIEIEKKGTATEMTEATEVEEMLDEATEVEEMRAEAMRAKKTAETTEAMRAATEKARIAAAKEMEILGTGTGSAEAEKTETGSAEAMRADKTAETKTVTMTKSIHIAEAARIAKTAEMTENTGTNGDTKMTTEKDAIVKISKTAAKATTEKENIITSPQSLSTSPHISPSASLQSSITPISPTASPQSPRSHATPHILPTTSTISDASQSSSAPDTRHLSINTSRTSSNIPNVSQNTSSTTSTISNTPQSPIASPQSPITPATPIASHISPTTSSDALQSPQNSLLSLTKNDLILGCNSAPNTLIEYSSLTCPACAITHKRYFAQFKKEYIDTCKIKYVFRDIPTNNASFFASMLIKCLKTTPENKIKIIDLLLQSPYKWAFSEQYTIKIIQLLEDNNIHITKKEKICTESTKLQTLLKAENFNHIKTFEINYTPIFFLNKNKMPKNFSLANIKSSKILN